MWIYDKQQKDSNGRYYRLADIDFCISIAFLKFCPGSFRNSILKFQGCKTKGTPKGRQYGKNPKIGRTVLENGDVGKKNNCRV